MPRIALRAYNREIESLIEKGQVDEAIAHCRHILKFFPKHIDTYRLLGKAFLEIQRYTEAADIFHRVLSSVPDDFISQVGMSIIREDEGNLDAAIWHMERAFETQPSNVAIQDELRRLYGQRDGVEPPRIRLSRGALIRMYARGELYPQAIAEARAALAEDPNRIDLEVILARMYYLSGQKVAATEVCTRLVNKLPYCFEANRILAEILPTTSRAQDAEIYRQRVYAMDPYLAYLRPGMISSLEVPENTVTLDHLEWLPEQDQEAQQPEWTRTVGVAWLGKEEEALPDWYSALREEPSEITTPVETPPEAETPAPPQIEPPTEAESLIPDWMREAGWKLRGGETEESGEETLEEALPESEIEPAEIPEWLQDIAPPMSEEPKAEESVTPEAEAWFDHLLKTATTSEPSPLESELPSGGPEQNLESELEPPVEWPESSEAPPSISGLQESETQAALETPSAEEAIPDWLAGIATPAPSTPEPTPEVAYEGEFVPAWLEDVESQPEGPSPTAEATPESEIESAFSAAQATPQAPPAIDQSQLLTDDIESALAWLESLAARQGADEATLSTPPEARSDEPPAWIRETLESTLPPESGEEAPLPAETPTFQAISEVTPAEETPELTAESPGVLDKIDEEAAFAWLESLAARPGADEETLLTQPEARQEEPPAWVRAELESSVSAEAQEVSPAPVPAKEEEVGEVSSQSKSALAESEAIPEWLMEAIEPISAEESIPSLEEVEESAPEAQSPAPPAAGIPEETQPVRVAPAAPPAEEAVPEWLKDLIESETQEISQSQPVETPAGGWITEAVISTSPLFAETSPAATGDEDALVWLHEAQTALQTSNLERALHFYNRLIQQSQYLEDVIHDLHEALYRFPIEVSIWQTLGDAYLRSNRIQEALDAYTKAEELLR